MIRKMVRMAIWGLMSKRREIVSTLQDKGILHVEHEESLHLSDSEADSLRVLRGKLLGMLESLEWDNWENLTEKELNLMDSKFKLPFAQMLEEIDKSLNHFRGQLSDLTNRRDHLKRYHGRLKNTHDITVHFRSFAENEVKQNQHVSVWWIHPEQVSSVLGELKALLSGHESAPQKPVMRYHVFKMREKDNLIALSVPIEMGSFIAKKLEEKKFIRWIPATDKLEENLFESMVRMEKEYKLLPEKEEKLALVLNRVREEWGNKLASLFILLDERLEQLVVEQGVKQSGDSFQVEGWLPEDDLHALSEDLSSKFGDAILIRWRYPVSEEWIKVPTSLHNPSVFKPFELFLKLVPLPNYRGTDPTVMIGLFFPFFTGCIIGDAGYGLVLWLLSLLVKRKAKSSIGSDIAYIMMTMSVWSVFWGIAYGEYFGDLAHKLFHIGPVWVERSQAVVPVLAFTIALGLAHVLLGLLLGILEGLRNSNRHVWMEKSGNFILILGMVGTLCAMKNLIPSAFLSVGVASLITGLILLVVGGGIGGMVEAMSSFGSILSYVRIGAIGLSSAILAIVASKFLDVFGVSFLGVFIALAIHLLNFTLAVAESGLHSARLHYVEFMGNFYTGGGNQYRPFAKKRRK